MKIVIIADKSSLDESPSKNRVQNIYNLFNKIYDDVLVQCPVDSVDTLSLYIPKERIMVEPVGRGTALAIGLAAAKIANINPKEMITFVFANQYMRYEDRLVATIHAANDMFKSLNRMLLIGVAITGVTTDYGYIKVGKVIQETSGILAFQMEGFERTPTAKQLESYMQSWRYLWDTGSMVCSAEVLLDIYKRTLPEIFNGLMTIKASLGTKFEASVTETVYHNFPTMSVAKGLYEKINKDDVLVLPVDLGVNV